MVPTVHFLFRAIALSLSLEIIKLTKTNLDTYVKTSS